jgi:hypothetical protein
MRTLSLLLAAVGGAAVFACSTGTDSIGRASDDLTEMELAKASLKIFGASQVPQEPGEQGKCSMTGCHSINPVTLQAWKAEFDAANAILASKRTNDEKIAAFRQDPLQQSTSFSPERLGILAAGAHLMTNKSVTADAFPATFAQLQKLKAVFEGKEKLLAELREQVAMPVLPDLPKLTPAQYETILTWFQKGLPKMDEILVEQRPTTCTDDFTRLRERTIAMKSKTWAAKNEADRMPMFACPPPNPEAPVSATACFTQQIDGKDVFPRASQTTFGTTWERDGSTIRVMRNFTSANSYWVRTSADGRFVATGGGSNGGAQAMDLKANLDGQSRDIGLRASYDPDFWPDNKAFMFQGGTKFCAQSLLAKSTTTLVSFSEPECSNLSQASGLYQTVGQVASDNALSDRFIVFSVWAGDSGSYTASARDTAPRGGVDSAINIYTAVAEGTDVEDGYRVRGQGFKIKTPYRGDTMMARSGSMLGSRWAYGQGADGRTPWGYALEQLDRTLVGDEYKFELTTIGNVCIKGNKANLSFDERFLASHHYNEPEDFSADDDPLYRQKGSSDIWVVDFVTGKKRTITKMAPGQFALFAHFRSDGWLYFLVVDRNTNKYMTVASDWAIRETEATPTP